MVLSSGARLGPYEIQAAIGAGGMGEVYKARDTRLDRTVAIKILPAELSADPDRRVRFEREARAIAALSHPHICTLHDIGTDHGTTYLVMEHLAGETLADRLRRGPLPVAQALELGAQIADALDAAAFLSAAWPLVVCCSNCSRSLNFSFPFPISMIARRNGRLSLAPV
jgi:serine/threonine protein kinase